MKNSFKHEDKESKDVFIVIVFEKKLLYLTNNK